MRRQRRLAQISMFIGMRLSERKSSFCDLYISSRSHGGKIEGVNVRNNNGAKRARPWKIEISFIVVKSFVIPRETTSSQPVLSNPLITYFMRTFMSAEEFKRIVNIAI